MRLLVRLLPLVRPHRRLTLFWALAAIGLILPWMTSCESPLTHLSRQEQPCTLQSIHDGDTMRLGIIGDSP
jgi:hypothetical protein